MQNENAEQAEQTASKIGKFNTAEDLLAAYNALESEFTKRCQLVKRLQTEVDDLRAQASTGEERREGASPDGVISSEHERDSAEIKQEQSDDDRPVPEVEKDDMNIPAADPPAITADVVLNEILQNACEYAELLCTVPEIMNACIASYKQRLLRPLPASSPSGMAVIVPAKRPKTLSEAKRLADAMLGN